MGMGLADITWAYIRMIWEFGRFNDSKSHIKLGDRDALFKYVTLEVFTLVLGQLKLTMHRLPSFWWLGWGGAVVTARRVIARTLSRAGSNKSSS
jgi:hypothetical protein